MSTNARKQLKVLMLLLIASIVLLCLLVVFIVTMHLSLASYLFIAILLVFTPISKALSKYGYGKIIKIIITIGLAISCTSLAVIVLWPEVVFLFFSWIRVSILISLTILVVPIPIILAALRHRFKETQIMISLTLVVISVVYLLMLILSAQLLYPMYITDLRTRYGSYCSLESAWLIAKEFSGTYFNVYGINEHVGFKLFPKIGEFGLISMELREILSAIARIGTCGEFAIGLTRLLRDSLSCETRVVTFKSIDHVFPEVKINGTWYVFDLTYTTQNKPVKADDYAKYVCSNPQYIDNVCRAGFKGLIDLSTGKDLRVEHGFYNKTAININS